MMIRWMRVAGALLTSVLFGLTGCDSDPTTTTCVAAGTMISTPLGEVPVETLRPGDEVLSVDPYEGRSYPAKIALVCSAQRPCVRLAMAGGRQIVATTEHPFLSPETYEYEPIARFAGGEVSELCQLGDGDRLFAVRVLACEELQGTRRVFDLTVDSKDHNFVANGFVAHNKTPAPTEVDVAGTWRGRWNSTTNGTTGELTLVLQKSDSTFGKASGSATFDSQSCIGEGQVDASTAGTFSAEVTGPGYALKLEGSKVDGKEEMRGDYEVMVGADCLGSRGSFIVSRAVANASELESTEPGVPRFTVFRIDEDGVVPVGEAFVPR